MGRRLLALKRWVEPLWPGALLLLATAAALRSPALAAWLAGLGPGLPYAIFGAGILLAWRFNRSRVAFALVTLALAAAALALAGHPATQPAVRGLIRAAVALLLPLDLAYFCWLTERGLVSAYGRLSLALIAVELLVIGLLCWDASLGAVQRGAQAAHPWSLPGASLPALGAALAAILARFALRRTAIEGGFVWTPVAAFLALRADGPASAPAVYLAAGGLVLIVSLVEESYALAYVDELTGLPGRRALDAALLALDPPYTIAMVDVDHFKQFNDTHGHDVGDQVLRKVAALIGGATGGGQAYRYGGEEFALIFSGKSVDRAWPHLERLRRAVESSSFVVRAPDRPRKRPPGRKPLSRATSRLRLTISIGAAEPGADATTPRQVIEAADRALYRAKEHGRNRVAT